MPSVAAAEVGAGAAVLVGEGTACVGLGGMGDGLTVGGAVTAGATVTEGEAIAVGDEAAVVTVAGGTVGLGTGVGATVGDDVRAVPHPARMSASATRGPIPRIQHLRQPPRSILAECLALVDAEVNSKVTNILWKRTITGH